MNLAHIHLLLNHFPTIGFGIGLALFLVAIVGKNEEMKRTGLVIFFLIAALAIPAYMSGNAAEETLCAPEQQCPEGVVPATIRAHEDAALIGFALMELTGFLAWLGLWQFRLLSRAPGWNTAAVLVLSLVTFAAMARAANIGGEIRHTEIAAAQATEPAPAAEPEPAAETQATPEAAPEGAIEVAPEPVPGGEGLARSLGKYVNDHEWLWPAAEALHFVGLCILFTVVLVLDLRILGMAKRISFPAVYQLLPLGMLGFALNLVTGMVFFLATPGQYTMNNIFYWKVLFIMAGAFNVLYFLLLKEPWEIGSGEDAPLTAKVMAGSAIAIWTGVLFFGHMLPFLGNSF